MESRRKANRAFEVIAGSVDVSLRGFAASALGERPWTFAMERSAQETRRLFAWRSFPEPVKNRRSQYRMPLRVGLCSGLGAPIFYRLWVSVPSASTRSLTPWQCGACSHGGASQSRLKTGAPSTECCSAPGFAHGWERRYFIGSGERPCGFATERSAQATRCSFAWRRFPEPVKNRRSQY